MTKRNGYLLAAVLFGLSFMTACSKNLMPPEGLGGAAPVGSQMSQSNGAGAGGSAGRGFNTGEQGSGSGFLTDENVGESARSGGFSSGGSDDGSALGGGRFQSDAEPFLGNGSSRSGEDEARTLPFKDTSLLQDIYYKFDKYDLDEDSRSTLRKNASYLKGNSSAVIEIQGHCDERGTNNYNVALGERRAHSAKMYLVSQGVSARRIHTISYGEERPFCFDSNAACWQNNRRAHFRISQ
jgi:peptidoglycan-associated lipoprotein